MSDQSDALRRDCPHCGCPGQWVDLNCGMCNRIVPSTSDQVDNLGHAVVEEVIGWRAFTVAYRGGKPILQSPVVNYTWEPGVPGGWYFAECEGSGSVHIHPNDPDLQHRNDQTNPARVVPSKECNGGGHGCGFYAGRTHAHLIEIGYAALGVMARIQMQGKIIPASNGYRAQQVKILTLYVPFEEWELARDLKAVYGPHGVEVECGQVRMLQKDSSPEWCERCKAKMPKRSASCTFCGYTHK